MTAPIAGMKTTTRWWMIAAVCIGVGLLALFAFGWASYFASWIATLVKATSGGFLGAVIGRYVTKLDLSTLPAEARPFAGIAQAILIAGGMMAVAFGA